MRLELQSIVKSDDGVIVKAKISTAYFDTGVEVSSFVTRPTVGKYRGKKKTKWVFGARGLSGHYKAAIKDVMRGVLRSGELPTKLVYQLRKARAEAA